MLYVRSRATYNNFITGRDVDSAVHREPCCSGYVIGMVGQPRQGDEIITLEEYEAEAALIKQHNIDHYVAPVKPTPPPTLGALLAPEMAGLTAAIAELKASFTTNTAAAAAAEKMSKHTDKMKLILEKG